ncbi:hypothetical protein IWQ61_004627 [Dispira simplex]|nr:hypothetical protein IWQ61_004627 [Dispira simplex]
MSLYPSDSESEERDDPLAWIQRSRRLEREKKRSRRNKPERTTSALPASTTLQTSSTTYTNDQLAGLKVGHAMEEFAVGDERVLTLQDTNVLEETEDQLVDVHFEERSKAQENLDNRKRKAGYTGFDDDEFTGVIGKKRTILSHYDEVLQDKKPRATFLIPTASDQNQLGDQVKSSVLASEADDGSLTTDTVSLDYKKGKAVQDYYTPVEVETLFRKPTKTRRQKSKSLRKKSSRRDETSPSPTVVETDTETAREEMEVYPFSRTAAHLPSSRFEETNFVDDDELQYALARTRRLRARKQTRPVATDVDLITTLAQQTRSPTSATNDVLPSDTEEGGLVISETADFVSQLTSHVTSQDDLPPNPPVPITGTTPPSDIPLSLSQEPVSLALSKPPAARESLDVPTGEKPEISTGTSHPLDTEEPLVSDGLAATLALLNQKGLVKRLSEEDKARERQYQERQQWIAKERLKDQRRQKEGSSTRSSRHRDTDTVNRDREFAREQQERMRNYRPDVRLEYTDEYGQILSTKEAFKHMSHKFHGNQSGKNKTEKRLRKLEQERKILATGSGDTPLHLSSLLQQQQESTNSAYVILSTGNKLGVNNIDLNPKLKK